MPIYLQNTIPLQILPHFVPTRGAQEDSEVASQTKASLGFCHDVSTVHLKHGSDLDTGQMLNPLFCTADSKDALQILIMNGLRFPDCILFYRHNTIIPGNCA